MPVIGMSRVPPTAWGFEKICDCDPSRSARLEACDGPGVLINALAQAIAKSKRRDLRVGVDSKAKKFKQFRTIIQFKIRPELYDWFFNARTGYRAQYWTSVENGLRFNNRLLSRLQGILAKRLSEELPVRKIEVSFQEGTRCERDLGKTLFKRSELLRSLTPSISKIWIGEHLIGNRSGPLENILLPTISAAARSPAELSIPRWKKAKNPKTGEVGEGLRAPLPAAEYSWLDLKGGFVAPGGILSQIKPQDDRSKQIHDYGWT
jgi:hypothetical protein